jgi:hypothetical protein
LKILLFVLFVVCCGLVVYEEFRMSYSIETQRSYSIETQRIVIKDSHGNKRGEFAASDASGTVSIDLFDTHSKMLVSLGVTKSFDNMPYACLSLNGNEREQSENGTPLEFTHIDSEGILIRSGSWAEKTGYQWSINASGNPSLSLEKLGGLSPGLNLGHDRDKYYFKLGSYDKSLLNGWEMIAGKSPSLTLATNQIKRIVLGCTDLVNNKTNDKLTTEPTIFVFDKDGNTLFKTKE